MASSSSSKPKSLKPGQACLPCRRQKVRCDGLKPSCSNCLSLSRRCEYKSHLSLSAKLEQRLDALESQIAEYEASAPHADLGPSGRVIPSPHLGITTIHGLSNWHPNTEMPLELRRQVLNLFLPLRSWLCLDICVSRWKRTIELPSTHPRSFHSGLLLAMVYAVCLIRGSEGSDLHSHLRGFERRAKEELQKSLSFCDRMEDWMYAGVIFATCEIMSGKLTQAMNSCAELVSMAFACNLDKFKDPRSYRNYDWGLMNGSPVQSENYALERANLWWSIFVLERCLAMTMSIAGSISIEVCGSVKTMLPVPLDEFSQGFGAQTFWNLEDYGHTLEMPTSLAKDSLMSVRVKCSMLSAAMRYINRLFNGDEPVTNLSWELYAIVDGSMRAAVETMPSGLNDPRGFHERTDYPDNIALFNPHIVRCELFILSAEISFAGILANKDDEFTSEIPAGFGSRETCKARQLTAARRMVVLVKEIMKRDPTFSLMYPHVYIGSRLHSCAEFLLRAYIELGSEDLKDDLEVLVDALEVISPTLKDIDSWIDFMRTRILA